MGRRIVMAAILAIIAAVLGDGCSSPTPTSGNNCGAVDCQGLACCDNKQCVPSGAFCCGNGSGGVCPSGYTCCPGGCCRGGGSSSGSSGGSGGGSGGGGDCATWGAANCDPSNGARCYQGHCECCWALISGQATCYGCVAACSARGYGCDSATNTCVFTSPQGPVCTQ